MQLRQIIRSLLLEPFALRAAADTIDLFRHIDDREAFREAVEQDGLDNAIANHTDLSNDEFHERVARIRERSEDIADEYPEFAEADREEIEQAMS